MNFFEKILIFFDAQMEKPVMYGWFHLLSLAVIIATTVLVCILIKNKTEKSVRIVVLTYSILTICLEIYKMLNFSFNSATGEWDFQWYAFPFQFCSTPMMIGLIAGLIKKGKVQECLYSYLATYALFAGVAVMVFPETVFVNTIGINIQTMICHGGMIVMGVYLYASKAVEPKLKTLLKASFVFVALALVALLLDIIVYKSGNPETFNMFFISPYYECTLPILNIVWQKAPYVVFLFVYLLGFSFCGFVMLLIPMLVNKIKTHKSSKQNI